MLVYLGDPVPRPCPAGYYCQEGTGLIDCPRLSYRDITGGANISDCFPCPAGYWCNMTAMPEYSVSPCLVS